MYVLHDKNNTLEMYHSLKYRCPNSGTPTNGWQMRETERHSAEDATV